MKIKIARLGILLFILMIFQMMPKDIYASDNLKMNISTEDGVPIAFREKGTIYSAVALQFVPDIDDVGQLYYNLSTDNGESFGGDVLAEEDCVVLYPDVRISADNLFVIRFKYIVEYAIGEFRDEFESNDEQRADADAAKFFKREYLSEEYTVKFDLSAPVLQVYNQEILEEWLSQPEYLQMRAIDEDGLIGRIVVFDNDEVVFEEHYNWEDNMSERDFEVPLNNEGEDNKLRVNVYDFASNSISTDITYKMDKTNPIISVSTSGDAQSEASINKAEIRISDNCINSTFCEYEIMREYEGITTIDNVGVSCRDNMGRIIIELNDEGIYRIQARAFDMAGNTSEEVSTTCAVDVMPPRIEIEGAQIDEKISQPVDINIRIYESIYEDCNVSVTAVRTRQDNQENLELDSFIMGAPMEERQIRLKKDGDYSILVKAVDGAGHEKQQMLNFRIDKNAPKLYLEGISNEEITNQIPVIRAHLYDVFYESTLLKMDLFKKNPDGIFVTAQTAQYEMKKADDEYELMVRDEGEYELSFTAMDSTGNRTEKVIRFGVDITPPEITGIGDLDGNYYKSFELPDNMKDYVYDTSNVDVNAFLNNTAIEGREKIQQDGRYMLWIGASDEAGNFAEDAAEFIVDNTKPQILVKGLNRKGEIKKGKMINISLVNGEDTIEQLTLNGKSIDIKNKANVDIPIDEYGDYAIEVKAFDNAGNDIDKTIRVSCTEKNYLKKPLEDMEMVLSKGAVLDFSMDQNHNDIDLISVGMGLIAVLGATFVLAYRAVFKLE